MPQAGKGKGKPQAKEEEKEVRENPYFDPQSAGTKRDRVARPLQFNTHGKYLEQASKLRRQEKLEEIKRLLASKNRKEQLDENSERGFLVQPPPNVEWWDEGILEEPTYDCIDTPSKVKIDADDSIITSYIQHPVLLKAPQDQLLIPVKPMYLTKKEQAKLRRMRRAEEHKEIQAKIRLGLEPPPPPKVKRGNMMRVMGDQAIADPVSFHSWPVIFVQSLTIIDCCGSPSREANRREA
jgi:U4/U6 small nuclear ribonucleoprotein PRP3